MFCLRGKGSAVAPAVWLPGQGGQHTGRVDIGFESERAPVFDRPHMDNAYIKSSATRADLPARPTDSDDTVTGFDVFVNFDPAIKGAGQGSEELLKPIEALERAAPGQFRRLHYGQSRINQLNDFSNVSLRERFVQCGDYVSITHSVSLEDCINTND
jgi:hypothetical protein